MHRLVPAAVSLLLVAACGSGGARLALTLPDDPRAVVLTVTSEGGFLPVEANLDRMPRFVLTADRSLVFAGPTTLEFPGPLLPNVLVTTISEEALAEVIELVSELGLPDIDEHIDESGAEMVADAPTDFITYYDESGPHRFGVVGLGMVEGGSTDRLLAEEIVQTLDQAAAAGDSRPYEPDRLQVAAGPPIPMDGAGGAVEDWPLEVPFDEMPDWALGWRCIAVEGADVDRLLDIFGAADAATRWAWDGDELGIKARPLFPGEEACAGAPVGG
jgi:hypothetical protein